MRQGTTVYANVRTVSYLQYKISGCELKTSNLVLHSLLRILLRPDCQPGAGKRRDALL